MKYSIFFVFLFFTVFIYANSQDYERKQLNVTVYNDNLGVIRDIRSIQVPKGISEIKILDVAELIDPTSVHIGFNGSVLEQNYQYDLVSMSKVLQKYIDKDVTFEGEKTISGKLLSITGNQVVLNSQNGGLIMIPDINKYQIKVGTLPEGLITRPTLVWKVETKSVGSQDIELSYQTAGMSWHTEYVAVLNENDTKTDLNSWVSVENKSGATYKDAVLKLIAGDVHKAQNIQTRQMGTKFLSTTAVDAGNFEEKAFFEYHIYDMVRPTTLANNETKQISLFEASDIKINKKFLYNSSGNNSQNQKVGVVVEFDNKKDNNLGMPMPKGKVRIYKFDGKSLEFIGEDNIDHTPKDERIKLRVGDAFDVQVDESVTNHNKLSNNIHEYEYTIKVKNHKDENITVDVDRNLWGQWEVLSSSIKYEKQNQSNILFKVPVKANNETELNYKVRFTY